MLWFWSSCFSFLTFRLLKFANHFFFLQCIFIENFQMDTFSKFSTSFLGINERFLIQLLLRFLFANIKWQNHRKSWLGLQRVCINTFFGVDAEEFQHFLRWCCRIFNCKGKHLKLWLSFGDRWNYKLLFSLLLGPSKNGSCSSTSSSGVPNRDLSWRRMQRVSEALYSDLAVLNLMPGSLLLVLEKTPFKIIN